MKIIRFVFPVLYCLLNYEFGYTQAKKVTLSEDVVYSNFKDDTSTVNTLNDLFMELRYRNPDSALVIANTTVAMSLRLEYEMGIADSKLRMGMICADLGKYLEGLRSCEDALLIYKKIELRAAADESAGLKSKIGRTYNVLGHNRIVQGNYTEALKNAFAALKIRNELGDKRGMSHTESNIGNIYYNLGDFKEALKHYRVFLALSSQFKDTSDMANATMNIATVHSTLGDYTQALKWYKDALRLAQAIHDSNTVGNIYLNMGDIYEQMDRLDEALKYYFTSLRMADASGDNHTRPVAFLSIGSVYTKKKNYPNANLYLGKGLTLSKATGDLEKIKMGYQYSAILDSAQGNYRSALENHKKHIEYRDSLVNEKNIKESVQLQMQYDFDIRETSLKQKELLIASKLKVERSLRYFYWCGLALLVLLLFFISLNFRNQKKLNQLSKKTHTREKLELESRNQQAMLKERLRISSELHDEVGATLSGISMYSHLTKEQLKTGKIAAMERSLTTMQISSSQMVEKLNEIVWLINPQQDSLHQLITRLEDYATTMAVVKGIQIKITIPAKLQEINLPVEHRRNIYLFCKEAINNAVKYSGCNLLELKVSETEVGVSFSVNDNGKGFDPLLVKQGNGLQNMQKRADQMDASVILQSQQNQGTSLTLHCKIT